MISVRTVGRFVVAGGGNTMLTAAVTSFSSYVMPVAVAYSVGYAAGLTLSVVTASRFVFRARLTPVRAMGVCVVNVLRVRLRSGSSSRCCTGSAYPTDCPGSQSS